MSRIDPARLSRILASLAKPKEMVEASGRQSAASSSGKTQKGRKDPAVLRASLKERLVKARKSDENFDSIATTIVVQEILLWEFGSEIVEHAAFDKAVSSIADAMRGDCNAEAAMSRLINELSSG